MGLGFSRSACSSDEFAKGAVEYFGLTLDPETFLESYRSWYHGLYPGALDLVKQLRQGYRVCFLSNMNEFYVPHFRQELRLHKIMNDCFFSNEIGMIKPDPNIYSLAAHRLRVEI